jgi:outer membrane protein assembly factor BamD
MLLLGACVLAFTGCTFFSEQPDITKEWSAQRLYRAAKEKLDEGDYETAIDYYEKLESRYPFGVLAQQAQIEIVYAYYKYEEPASAIAAADRFLKLYPQHPAADYVYYIKGLTSFNRGKTMLDRIVPRDPSERDPGAALQAFRDFEELTKRYPESQYAEDAAQRMLYLKNILAEHEVHVANYYLRRSAYLASLNRAKEVVEHYPETPSVPKALAIMAKTYKIMGMDDLAADSLRVLRLNFPGDEGIAEVERLVLN